jgi:hypothetical protein
MRARIRVAARWHNTALGHLPRNPPAARDNRPMSSSAETNDPVSAPATRAASADRHRLYEQSVQCVEAEVDFIAERFERLRGRPARSLREDFCGTGAICCEWVRRDPGNRATGLDIDPGVLRWGHGHNVATLAPAQRRQVALIEADVLTARVPRSDVIIAMNFSYWLLKERATLRRYFVRVREQLADDGVLFLDAYGGYDAFRVITEEREVDDGGDGFTYVWEQADYNPITGELRCHIHFDFPDGSRLERAFSYDWRLWTLPEIRELLAEAGFTRVICWWQGWDADDAPDGLFEPAERADADAGWICYVTAER